MLKTEKIDGSLLELKDRLEYMAITELFEALPTSNKSVASVIIQELKIAIEQSEATPETVIFDLTEFDPLFSFTAPPNLPIFHLTQALREIHKHNTPETLKKYAYIGFNREQIGKILGVDFYTAEQKEKLSQLRRQLQQAKGDYGLETNSQMTAEQDLKALQQEKTALEQKLEHTQQILAAVIAEYSKTTQGRKLLHGGKISKSKTAIMTTTSELQKLFKHPKGEQTYRKTLSFLDTSLHFLA